MKLVKQNSNESFDYLHEPFEDYSPPENQLNRRLNITAEEIFEKYFKL